MIFVVNRLNITGPLHEDTTPIEVLLQCMTSHGIEACQEMIQEPRYRRKCIQKLSNNTPLTIKDVRKAARYVNINTTFTSVDVLQRAMGHLFSFETFHSYKTLSIRDFPVGPITDRSPDSLDCTILYRVCRERGLVTRPDYTTNDLVRLIRFDDEGPLKPIQDFLVDRIQTSGITEILNVFYPLFPKSCVFDRRELYKSYASLRRALDHDTILSDPLKLRMPTTDHEAVLLAAGNYATDISESRFPLMEYAILFKYGSKDRSFPVDSVLQERVQRDSYALNLRQRFNHLLPEFVYNTEDLKKMATEEGWVGLESPYEFLCSIVNTDTFYAYEKGPMVGIKPMNQELTIELESVNDQEPANLVLFGRRSNVSALHAVSWFELTTTFENYNEFRNPLLTTSGVFSDHAMNKLVILAKKPCIDQTIADRRKRLVLLIEKIRLDNQNRMNYLNIVKTTIQASPSLKSEIQKLFDILYRLSLTMRSLGETETLPDDGSGGAIDPETTQMNVSLLAVHLDETLRIGSEWSRDTFLNLPLIIYYARENKFSTSEESFEGHTIGGRLKIVHSGENTPSVSSCLRLSSNWFLSTVYYYQSMFGFPIYFDITRLKHIG